MSSLVLMGFMRKGETLITDTLTLISVSFGQGSCDLRLAQRAAHSSMVVFFSWQLLAAQNVSCSAQGDFLHHSSDATCCYLDAAAISMWPEHKGNILNSTDYREM